MCFYCFSGERCGQQAVERRGEKGILVRHRQTAWSTVSHLPTWNRTRPISSVTPALGTLLLQVWVKQASTHEIEKNIFLPHCVQQSQAGPTHTWCFGAAVETALTIESRCRMPDSIILACFPASGDFVVPIGAKMLLVSANGPLRHLGRVSGEGSCSFYSITFLNQFGNWISYCLFPVSLTLYLFQVSDWSPSLYYSFQRDWP